MTANFHVIEHTIVSAYVREYAFATVQDQEDKLRLHVKQYVPHHDDNSNTVPANPITIIACGALGLPKEVYEPLWDELYQKSRSRNWSIRSIWITDPVNMGASAALNEGKLGDDPSWIDHTRDLFLLINNFRDQMPRPLVGIGHSFGGVQLVHLSLFHPRLFSTLILMDPYVTRMPPANFRNSPVFHQFVVDRQSSWPSRSSAEAALKRSPLYYGFDPRCIELLLRHGFRDLPSSSGNKEDPPVAWTTSSAQEVHSMGRPSTAEKQADGTYIVDRKTCPDLDPLDAWEPIYRWEPRAAWDRIVELRPPTKWVLGAHSYIRLDEIRKGILRCGTGRSGSGGTADGRVVEVTIEKAGHFFPFQVVGRTAAECLTWLDQEVPRWYEEEHQWKEKCDRRLKNGERIGLELGRGMRETLDREKLKPRVESRRETKI
jgi:pimeloyl-ACP methyl ester carboxylesterase